MPIIQRKNTRHPLNSPWRMFMGKPIALAKINKGTSTKNAENTSQKERYNSRMDPIAMA
ncbi:MAG: hypothetical protein HQ473_06520 [Cryomorphaceae bacterium]|nr:hypothetical protein [Cryomorphaceae bacterium]